MQAHLVERSAVRRFVATMEADHGKSIALLERVGMRPGTAAESNETESNETVSSPTERLFVGDA